MRTPQLPLPPHLDGAGDLQRLQKELEDRERALSAARINLEAAERQVSHRIPLSAATSALRNGWCAAWRLDGAILRAAVALSRMAAKVVQCCAFIMQRQLLQKDEYVFLPDMTDARIPGDDGCGCAGGAAARAAEVGAQGARCCVG